MMTPIIRFNKLVYQLSLLLFLVLGLNACYYDVEQKLYPAAVTCDTTNTTFSIKIKPIIASNCGVCHSTANCTSLGAGINLETYVGIKAQVDNGRLVKSIKHEPPASPMPKGVSTKIDACQISQIEYWVNQGAKNN